MPWLCRRRPLSRSKRSCQLLNERCAGELVANYTKTLTGLAVGRTDARLRPDLVATSQQLMEIVYK